MVALRDVPTIQDAFPDHFRLEHQGSEGSWSFLNLGVSKGDYLYSKGALIVITQDSWEFMAEKQESGEWWIYREALVKEFLDAKGVVITPRGEEFTIKDVDELQAVVFPKESPETKGFYTLTISLDSRHTMELHFEVHPDRERIIAALEKIQHNPERYPEFDLEDSLLQKLIDNCKIASLPFISRRLREKKGTCFRREHADPNKIYIFEPFWEVSLSYRHIF